MSPEDTPSAASAAVVQTMLIVIGGAIVAFGVYWFANWPVPLLAFPVALFGAVMAAFGLFGLVQSVALSVRKKRA